MSNEEQNRQNPPSGQNNENRNRRRWHHHGPKRPDQSNPQNTANQNQGTNPSPNAEKKDGNQNRQKSRHRNRRGKSQKENFGARTPDDFKQSREEQNDGLSLEEWRARIVIRPADENASVEPKPTAPAEQKVQPEEPISISAEELLSPVLDGDSAKGLPKSEQLEVIGVQFRASGKSYYFDPKGKKVRVGNFVVVETARGLEYGEVTSPSHTVRKSIVTTPLRPLIRIATEADTAQNTENHQKEQEAFEVCKQKIAEHKLPMKLIDVQYAFDRSRILFYFSAENRVDFRDLVKDLASVFHTRIELRQIGIRDEAKLLGGLGACGRPLCCSAFLPDFAQVTIKMAKEQGLSLNSNKISGTCGRLMCCLRYESETYAEELRRLPAIDSAVKTPDGIGTVVAVSPIAGTIRVLLESAPDAPAKIYACEDITPIAKEKGGQGANPKQPAPDAKK